MKNPKVRTTIIIDKETDNRIQKGIDEKKFGSRSHCIQLALTEFFKDE